MDTVPHVEVRVRQRFSAPAERVFNAWVDPTTAGKWLFATAWRPMSRVKIDARVGGSFSFVDRQGSEEVEHAGEYLDIVRPRRLVFALSMENSPKVVTRVIAEIAPLKQGCELTLTHEGVPLGVAARTEGRWSGMLYGLATILKSA